MPAPIELAVDEKPQQRGVDDADGRDLGRRRDPADDGGADHERQGQARHRDHEGASHLRRRCPRAAAGIGIAGAEPGDDDERQRRHRGRQQTRR